MIYLIYNVISDAKKELSRDAARILSAIWWLFVISWMLYPDAYLMPLYINSEIGVVGRQITYTAADILSKVVYSVMLTQVATIKSNKEGSSMKD